MISTPVGLAKAFSLQEITMFFLFRFNLK